MKARLVPPDFHLFFPLIPLPPLAYGDSIDRRLTPTTPVQWPPFILPTRLQRTKDNSPSQSRLVLPPTNITRRPTYMATPSKNGPEHNMANHPPHRINANTATEDRSRHAPTQAKHTETDTRRQKPIPHTSIPTAPTQAPSPSSSTPPTTP